MPILTLVTKKEILIDVFVILINSEIIGITHDLNSCLSNKKKILFIFIAYENFKLFLSLYKFLVPNCLPINWSRLFQVEEARHNTAYCVVCF